MEDLSGYQITATNGWAIEPDEGLPPTLYQLLKHVVGRFYVPYMLANAQAWERGEDHATFEDSESRSWASAPFKYQTKCVGWLRETYQSLSQPNRQVFDKFINGTGCENLFTEYPHMDAKL